MSKVNLAIIGYGLVGKRHAEAIKAYPDANLSAIVENDPNSLEGLKDDLQEFLLQLFPPSQPRHQQLWYKYPLQL